MLAEATVSRRWNSNVNTILEKRKPTLLSVHVDTRSYRGLPEAVGVKSGLPELQHKQRRGVDRVEPDRLLSAGVRESRYGTVSVGRSPRIRMPFQFVVVAGHLFRFIAVVLNNF